MKTAKIVSVRVADPSDGHVPSAEQAVPVSVSRMSEALRRYPDVSEEERLQMVRFFKQGAQEDIVRATYELGLEPRLVAFQRDHPKDFPAGLRAWAPIALMTLVPVLFVLWHLLH